MGKGDIRTFGSKRYRYMGWSRDRDNAEKSADIGRKRSNRSYRIVKEKDSSGKVNGYATYREIR